MDMHQGQMCKIRRRADGKDMGLYQKLRASDGKQRYYRVRVVDKSTAGLVAGELTDAPETLEASNVQYQSGNANANRATATEPSYEITCVIPPEVQQKLTMISSDEFNGVEGEIRRTAYAADIANRKREVCRILDAMAQRLTQYQSLLDSEKQYRDELREMEDMEGDLGCGMIARPIMYVYGKHDGDDREFCWIAPRSLEDQLVVGCRAVADTSVGEHEFTVTRIERQYRIYPHKRVLRVLGTSF